MSDNELSMEQESHTGSDSREEEFSNDIPSEELSNRSDRSQEENSNSDEEDKDKESEIIVGDITK